MQTNESEVLCIIGFGFLILAMIVTVGAHTQMFCVQLQTSWTFLAPTLDLTLEFWTWNPPNIRRSLKSMHNH
jgi:hypothetical protein